jgi:UDP-N-acetylglucosamine:LPS N-acetylglucosamine transferase
VVAVPSGTETTHVRSEPRAAGRRARVDVLLACSSGGHLLQLLALREAWEGYEHLWVSDDTPDVRSILGNEPLVLAHGPTTRNAWTLVRNLALAWRVCRSSRPRVVVTTGAGTAVPFAWIGRLLGARVVYVESLTRTETPSLSLRLVAPIASRVYVQWPELADRLGRARYVGTVLGNR